MLKPQLTVNLSIKEDSSVAYSAVLTHPIDAHVEAARGEKIEELESTIKDEGYRRIGESAVRISCRGGKAQVFCCQTSSCLCKFPLVQRFVCRLLMMFFIWWQMQLPLWRTVELLVMIYPDAHQKHVTQPWFWTSVDFDETSGQLSWTRFGSTFFSQPVTVSRIFSMQILCLYQIWPSRALVIQYLPKEFKETFSSTRVTIDLTELPLEKPSNLMDQAATWSNYKNRNTLSWCQP